MDVAATQPVIGKRAASFVPAILDLSVTDFCNADCTFCGFARSKMKGVSRKFVDFDGFVRALPILKRRGIGYLNFQGGEPLLHSRIIDMVAAVRDIGMKPSLITNSWKLPEKADALADAGLQNLLISIDSHNLDAHEKNRGLRDVRRRIINGVAKLKARGLPTMACVTVSKLVDFAHLPETLRGLGFDAVTFSYPRREAFGSSSLVYDENSDLVDFSDQELLDALDAILALKRGRFPVLNPSASIEDIKRHVRGERELFDCVGGFKYFYMDWKLDIWRCEAWHEPLGSVFEFEHIAEDRTRCTACIMNCYRDTSTLMHAGIAIADAGAALGRAAPIQAAKALLSRSMAGSIAAVAGEMSLFFKLGR